jgi:hypothetical protein
LIFIGGRSAETIEDFAPCSDDAVATTLLPSAVSTTT